MPRNRRFIRSIASVTLSLAATLAHAYGEPITSFKSQSFPGWSCYYGSVLGRDNVFFGAVQVPGANPPEYSIAKFLADGSIDTTWGDHGVANDPDHTGPWLALPDGGVLSSRLRRYRPDGSLDSSYGTDGIADWPYGSISALALAPDSGFYALQVNSTFNPTSTSARIAHIDAHGHLDKSFGSNGTATMTLGATSGSVGVYAFSVFSDGSAEFGVYDLYSNVFAPSLHRYPADFGVNGAPSTNGRLLPHGGIANWTTPFVGADASGHVYFARGVGGDPASSGVRLLRYNPDGTVDTGFANGNAFIVATGAQPGVSVDMYVGALWHNADGSWTVKFESSQYTAGWAHVDVDGRTRTVRFLADGTADPAYAQASTLPGGALAYSRATNGDLVSLSSQYGQDCGEARWKGDVPAENAMVEYYAPALDHYFITLEGAEAIGLDTTPAGNGWQRTGLSFGAWMLSDLADTKKLCRFYGDLQAGPNSHFYTPEGPECDGLKALADKTPVGQYAWRYEGLVGNVAIPRNGACANNLTPVYRLYNKGFEKGGVPNHRYTTDTLVYQQMQAQDWAGEGIAFCVPPPPTNPPG